MNITDIKYLVGFLCIASLLLGNTVLFANAEPDQEAKSEAAPITEAAQLAPKVVFHLSSNPAHSLVSVSRLVDHKHLPTDSNLYAPDLDPAVETIRAPWLSEIYLIRDGKAEPFASLWIERRWFHNRDIANAYDMTFGSRMLDVQFDGQRLFALYSWSDRGLYLSVGKIDKEAGRVLSLRSVELMSLGSYHHPLFPGESDLTVNESGVALVRVRVAGPDGEAPITIKTLPIAPDQEDAIQETLSLDEYERLLEE